MIENEISEGPATGKGGAKRRSDSRLILAAMICLMSVLPVQGSPPAGTHPGREFASTLIPQTVGAISPPPDKAVEKLVLGNRRFRSNSPKPKHEFLKRRALARGQHPFAAVFCCSDSRVAPEIVFDAGLGEVFTIRLAGNVTDIDGIAGAEYAVEHLGVRLIVVLGHTSCGAIAAAADHSREGRIADLVRDIEPALAGVPDSGPRTDFLTRAAHANVLYQIRHLTENSPAVSREIETGRIKILGGLYDLNTAAVHFFDAAGRPVFVSGTHRTAARGPARPHLKKRKDHRHAPNLRG